MKKIIYLLLLAFPNLTMAKEAAFFCKWNSGDIIVEVTLKDGQKDLTRSYDTDSGTLSINFQDLSLPKFDTLIQFYEKSGLVEKPAKCTMVSN